MPTVELSDLERMREAVFFDEPEAGRKMSRFWALLILASIIAAAGVVGDSTATVIGAMIVAPLMTPILGTMLGVVLGDRSNLVRSILFVLGGAAAAIAIGYLLGMFVTDPVTAATNAQVAARVNPRLIDLVAALATGVVGSVALVRRDISDTLPGVAIAISLVPPLSVVGLTLESGAVRRIGRRALSVCDQRRRRSSRPGIIVMALYRVHRMVPPAPTSASRRVNRRNAVLVIVAFFLIIGGTLSASTSRINDNQRHEAEVRSITQQWADEVGWEVIEVSTTGTDVVGATDRHAAHPRDRDVRRGAGVGRHRSERGRRGVHPPDRREPRRVTAARVIPAVVGSLDAVIARGDEREPHIPGFRSSLTSVCRVLGVSDRCRRRRAFRGMRRHPHDDRTCGTARQVWS